MESSQEYNNLINDRNRWRTLAEICFRLLKNRNHDTMGHTKNCKTINFQNETCACGFSSVRKLYQEAFDKTIT